MAPGIQENLLVSLLDLRAGSVRISVPDLELTHRARVLKNSKRPPQNTSSKFVSADLSSIF